MALPGPYPTLELRFPRVGKTRLSGIDELKGLAMILIILYHAGGGLVWQNFLHGDLGVDLFVILSGVGLAMSTRTETITEFFRRRFLRVFPAYWVALTVFLVLCEVVLQRRHSAFDIVVHYLGIHAWFGDAIGLGINDSFWFVTLIVDVYLLYGLFIRRILNRPDLIVLLAALACIPIAYAYFETGQAGCFGHIAMRLPGFFAGVLLGRLLREGSLSLPLSPYMALGLMLIFYVPYTHGITFYSVIVALGLTAGYVYFWKGRVPAVVTEPTGRVLRFFGKYSLEIFLIHQPLIRDYNYYIQARFLHDTAPSTLSRIIGMAIGLSVTLVLAVVLHHFINRIVGYFRSADSSPATAAQGNA